VEFFGGFPRARISLAAGLSFPAFLAVVVPGAVVAGAGVEVVGSTGVVVAGGGEELFEEEPQPLSRAVTQTAAATAATRRETPPLV
jgi:hypothetical protein